MMSTTIRSTMFLLLSAVPGLCGIFGSVPLSQLISKADQVVVATVQAVDNNSGEPTIQLLVNRHLKGSLKPSETVVALLPSGSYTFPKIFTSLVGKTGIWFLTTSVNNQYVLPIVMGDVLTTDMFIEVPSDDLPAKYVYSDDADPRVKVFSELEATALNSHMANTLPKLLSRKMFDDGMGVDLRQSFFTEISASSITTAKLVGLAGQIRSSQQGSVAAFLNLPFPLLSQAQVALLARAICDYRGTDLGGISALTTLSQLGGAQNIRECAAHALREIHTKDTMNSLLALLDNPNETIRYDAVIGIAQFAMNFPLAKAEEKKIMMSRFQPDASVTAEMRQNYPRTDQFSQNEKQYINYWKTWLESHPVH